MMTNAMLEMEINNEIVNCSNTFTDLAVLAKDLFYI